MRILSGLCLGLIACEPVLLQDGTLPPSASQPRPDAAVVALDAGRTESAPTPITRSVAPTAQAPFRVEPVRAQVGVIPHGCEGCFTLFAIGLAGTPPYKFAWSDGSTAPQREACGSGAQLSLVVEDATGMRTAPLVPDLQTGDAGCEAPPAALCLVNPSFEATQLGAAPLQVLEWSDCTHEGFLNTPDIGSAQASPSQLVRLEPTDGTYYLGLSEGEQVSQRVCETWQTGETRSFALDLARVRRSAFAPGAAQQSVFLEIWGGIAADCSQRQLLWASPPATDAWVRHCVTFSAAQYADQITLRARSDMTASEEGYLAVDHLMPVEHCPEP